MAAYTRGTIMEWREVESGQLPEPRFGLRAAMVDNVIYVTGGNPFDYEYLTSILSWDPLTESWQPAGNLAVGRHNHATVAIPSSIIESQCLAMV